MEFYAAAKGNIKPADMTLFGNVARIVEHLPDIVFDPKEREWELCKNQVTCHLICRALAAYFPAECVDGYFTKGYQHSWLVPHSRSSIIDVYPVAGASPFIVSMDWRSPWKKFYLPADTYLSNRLEGIDFVKRLEVTAYTVAETMRTLGIRPQKSKAA